jgi:hypothetical protein
MATIHLSAHYNTASLHNHPWRAQVGFPMVLMLAALVATAVQEKRELPKRGDSVIVSGCVSRGRIESNDVKVADRDATFERMVTYRLSGDKKVLESLKKEHEGHFEVLTAVLKSELPIDEHKQIGNSRIGIGLPGRNDPAAPPSYPVLEVKSAEHTQKSCR